MSTVVALSLLPPLTPQSSLPRKIGKQRTTYLLCSSHQTLCLESRIPCHLFRFVIVSHTIHLAHLELPSNYLATRDSITSPLPYLLDQCPSPSVSRKESQVFFLWDGFWFVRRSWFEVAPERQSIGSLDPNEA